MKDRKILFVDLDGTLLTDSKEITQENLAAIRKATEQGHAVVVTTGRPLYSTERLLGKLGLTSPGCYAITSNGAMIYDSGEKKVLFQTGVSRDCLREAFDEAFKAGIHPQTYSDCLLYTSGGDPGYLPENHSDYRLPGSDPGGS